MNKIYYVDLPNPHSVENWINVKIYSYREEAEEFLFCNYGIPYKHSDLFIIEGEV